MKVEDNTTKAELYALVQEKHGVTIGNRCKVFDRLTWIKNGYIGDNECYYVDAVVLNIRIAHFNEVVIDVLIDGRISTGHYI